MGQNISLDIAALILLGILLLSCIFRKMTSGVSNHIFIALLVAAIISTVFEIAGVCLDHAQIKNESVLYIAHAGYLISYYLSAPLHFFYVVSLTDIWHKLRKNLALQITLFIPLIIMIAAFLANAGDHMTFSLDAGYTQDPWFIVMLSATLLYILYDIICIVRYHKLFDLPKIISVSVVFPISAMATLLQKQYPNMLITMFGMAIGLLIISIGIQRPEEHIDSFTLLMKHSAYVHDMKRAYYNHKHMNVIMLNISNFHTIQLMIGFDAAMQIIREVADHIRELNKRLYGYAELYYLDNGRFRMVFDRFYEDRADVIAEQLNKDLKRITSFNGLDISLTPFIVLARCPEEIKDFKMLMSFGLDFHKKHLYTGDVMKAGEMYNPTQLDIQNNIDLIIDHALENNSFEVYYQPIYSVSHGRFISAEALIRLFDPQYGYIPPETLITAAENNGTIHKIGELVFEKVCQFIVSADFKNLRLDYIEINLSVAQIMNSDLPDKLFALMRKYNISPDKINLEITETAAAYAQRVMTENLDRLMQAGFSFSLDDYGTGYSNMKRVIQLPLKIIKLDKSFVDERNNPKMWIFLKNTVKMLKDMNMEIVVEGVETQEMLDAFSDMQCDFIQGYFFSKPIPKKEFITFISNANSAVS